MNLKLITFDVTNTILRFSCFPSHHYSKVANLYGVKVNEKKVEESYRQIFKRKCATSPNFGVNENGWFDWWSDVIGKTIVSSHDTPVDETILHNISEHLINLYSTSEAYDIVHGFFPLVQYLKERGIVIGALSNTDERLKSVLSDLKILQHFNFVLTSYNVGVLKPDERIFQHALNSSPIPVAAEEALHVGDSLSIDYLGAKKAGWKSILVASDFEEQCKKAGVSVNKPYMVSTLKDILPILEKL